MEVSTDARGRMTVRIDGVVYTCTADVDCPFESTCAVNAPWSALSGGMCVCPIDYMRTGSTCHDVTQTGYGMFGLLLVALALAVLGMCIGGYDIYLMRQAQIKFTYTAVQTSLGFLSIGSFMMFVSVLCLIGETFSTMTLMSRVNGVLVKAPSFFVFTNICVAMMLYFVQLGMLNVCLVWHEVTDLRRRFTGNIKKFRNLVTAVSVIYFIVYVALIAVDRMLVLAYFSVPGFILIIAGYVFGYFKLASVAKRKQQRPSNMVVRTSASDNPGFELGEMGGVFGLIGLDPGNKPKSSNKLLKDKRKEENLKKKLRNISNIALAMVCLGTFSLVALFVVGGLNGSADTPLLSVTAFMFRTSLICFGACMVTVSIYVHLQVCVLVGKKSRFIATPQSSLSARYSSRFRSMKKKKSAGALVAQYDEKTGMSEILKRENAELRTKFTEFVRSKYADEPLVFYDACLKYEEAAKQSRSTLKGKNVLLITLGNQIVDNFIRDDSIKWVNVSDDVRKELIEAASKSAFDEHTFEKAKAMAFELLKQNFYHQFIKMLQDEEDEDAQLGGIEEDVIAIRQVRDLKFDEK